MIKISRQEKRQEEKKLGGKRQKCNGGSCKRERNKNEARQKRQIETEPEGGEKVNPRRHGYCRKNAHVAERYMRSCGGGGTSTSTCARGREKVGQG